MSIFRNLSDSVRDSLKAYKGDDYDNINTSLRQNLPLDQMCPYIKKHIENIDSAMSHGNEITVYRGIKDFQNLLKYYQNVEDIGVPRIIELGFCSVTKNLSLTEPFVDKKNGCCVIAFQLTPDIKRYDFMDELFEKEVLIQRNIQLILESDEYKIVNKSKVYKAIIKPYNPPKITEKDMEVLQNLDNSIDIEQKAIELYEELEQESFGESIEIKDIDILIDTYQHWPQKTKDLVKKKLIEMSKI